MVFETAKKTSNQAAKVQNDSLKEDVKAALSELTMQRKDAVVLCVVLGMQFIQYFDKIFSEPTAKSAKHWIKEMENRYKTVTNIFLKPNLKKLDRTSLDDWFFTVGSEPSTYLKKDGEVEKYDEFCNQLLVGNSIRDALIKANVLGTDAKTHQNCHHLVNSKVWRKTNMNILYLHGLASSKEANTPKILKDLLPNDNVLSIDIPAEPNNALKTIFKVVGEFCPNVIVGTSLGGFYALFFDGPWKILINPALKPDKELIKILGRYGSHKYLKPRENGDVEFDYTENDEKSFKNLRKNLEEKIKYSDHICRTYALFADDDDVVNDRKLFYRMFDKNHVMTFSGGHRISKENTEQVLIPLINKLRN